MVKSFAAHPPVPTVRSPSPFAPSSSPAAATPKTLSPTPSPRASRNTSSSEQASTPSPTATLTRSYASSRSTTPRRSSGSASCFKPAASPLPPNLTYAPVDFERESLPEQLHSAGFDPQAPAFFAWLGVVPYLTLEAFRSTIAFIGQRPAGSGVVLDYSQPRSALPFLEKLAHDSLAARVQLAGEPFQLFFTPTEIAAELTHLRNIEDIGSAEINARYFTNRTDDLKLRGSSGRLLSAWL